MSWISVTMVTLLLLGAVGLAIYGVMAFGCLRDRALPAPLRWGAPLPPLALLGAWRQRRRGQVILLLLVCGGYAAVRGTLAL